MPMEQSERHQDAHAQRSPGGDCGQDPPSTGLPASPSKPWTKLAALLGTEMGEEEEEEGCLPAGCGDTMGALPFLQRCCLRHGYPGAAACPPFPCQHISFSHPKGSLSGSVECTWTGTEATAGGHTGSASPNAGGAATAIIQRVLVCVPSAARSPDTAGGRAAVPGSDASFPGRQPVASSFLKSCSRLWCGVWLGSARASLPGVVNGEERDENRQFWMHNPKPQRKQGCPLRARGSA